MTERVQAESLAEAAWRKLMDFTRQGLPEVYESFQDYLSDFYPDLPWDEVGSEAACEYLLLKPEWDFDLIRQTFAFDMRASLERARDQV